MEKEPPLKGNGEKRNAVCRNDVISSAPQVAPAQDLMPLPGGQSEAITALPQSAAIKEGLQMGTCLSLRWIYFSSSEA